MSLSIYSQGGDYIKNIRIINSTAEREIVKSNDFAIVVNTHKELIQF